jgi:hypothetical protein
MKFVARFDGVDFAGDYQSGKFTRGKVSCPNCGAPLQQQSAGSASYLICSTKEQGCVTPVKTFSNEQDMNECLESGWREVEKRCLSSA